MATWDELHTAFRNLVTALDRVGADQPPPILALRNRVSARAVQIANGNWDALPASSPGYDPVVTALRNATNALNTVDLTNEAAVRAALNQALQALNRLGQLLGA